MIELLLVVLVVGIIALVSIPRFTDSAEEAREAALKSNLKILRSAVERYYHEHGGRYPGDLKADGSGAEASSADRWDAFSRQLTHYSDAAGKTHHMLDRANYPHGPYLKTGIPANPLLDSDAPGTVIADSVKVVASAGSLVPEGAATRTGWIFNCKTGEFIANNDDLAADQVTQISRF